MTTKIIELNKDCCLITTVNESDKYSKKVHIKFEKSHKGTEINSCNEIFLSVENVDELGKFLLRQSDKLRAEQKSKN